MSAPDVRRKLEIDCKRRNIKREELKYTMTDLTYTHVLCQLSHEIETIKALQYDS